MNDVGIEKSGAAGDYYGVDAVRCGNIIVRLDRLRMEDEPF